MRGDWKDEAMQYRDVDRAAQKKAEDTMNQTRHRAPLRGKRPFIAPPDDERCLAATAPFFGDGSPERPRCMKRRIGRYFCRQHGGES